MIHCSDGRRFPQRPLWTEVRSCRARLSSQRPLWTELRCCQARRSPQRPPPTADGVALLGLCAVAINLQESAAAVKRRRLLLQTIAKQLIEGGLLTSRHPYPPRVFPYTPSRFPTLPAVSLRSLLLPYGSSLSTHATMNRQCSRVNSDSTVLDQALSRTLTSRRSLPT